MSDPFFEEEDEPEDRTVTVKRSQIKALEDMAKAGKKASDRLAELERENAFARAGIPVNDKRAGYFIKGYEGETTPEAISAAWEDAFGQSPPETHGIDPAEAAAHQRVSEASTGAEPPKTSLTLADLENAQSPEEVIRMSSELGILHTRE